MLLERFFLFALFFLILLNYGVQVRTFGGIPFGEWVLIFGLLATFSTREWNAPPRFHPAFLLATLFFLAALIHLAFDAPNYGLWAFRDASHAIEMTAILIGARLPIGVWMWIGSKFRMITLVVAAYSASYLLREQIWSILPSQVSSAGAEVVLAHYISTPTLLIVLSFSALALEPRRETQLVIFSVLVFSAIVFFQSRTTYLQIGAGTIWLAATNRESARQLLIALALCVALLALLPYTGLQIPGRLGVDFDLSALIRHVQAISGESTDGFEAAAEGVSHRQDWWRAILERNSQSVMLQFFGTGYGLPLIDYVLDGGVIVREPHNSYMSAYGRLGLLGVLLLVSIHLSLLVAAYSSIHKARWIASTTNIDLTFARSFLVLASNFMIAVIIFAIGEDGFEKPFFAVPFYFLAGGVINVFQNLKSFEYRIINASH